MLLIILIVLVLSTNNIINRGESYLFPTYSLRTDEPPRQNVGTHANHHSIGAHVDPMWTRCGPVVDRVHMRITILVTQMWTRPPFGLYNIIRDVSGESTWTSMQHCTGPPWFQMGLFTCRFLQYPCLLESASPFSCSFGPHGILNQQ